MQNRRPAIHEKEADNVQHQYVLEISKGLLRQVVVELDRAAIVIQQQVLVGPESREEEHSSDWIQKWHTSRVEESDSQDCEHIRIPKF